MLSFIFALVLAAIALMSLALYKTYHHIPHKELKRLARQGDDLAALLYKPVAYGASLRLLLWIITGLSAAGSVVLFSSIVSGWVAFILVVLIIWVGFAWIPSGGFTKGGLWMAQQVAPAFAWLLERLQPVLSIVAEFIQQHRPITVHTGLYEKEDLAMLLRRQQEQSDNRIPHGEIELLVHALSFGDMLVGDVLVPKRVVTAVSIDEHLGPILTDELHKSGHSRFPVYEGKHDNIVGILYLRDMVANKSSGTVKELMKHHLTYVHEDFTLYQTLQAFIKTKHHLFLVVNSFEEFVGIITIEDVIEQIVGQPIVDEFDRYDDLRAVAAAAAQKEHKEHDEPKPESEPQPDDKDEKAQVDGH